MEILKIGGDTVLLLYHASESAEVGEQFEILESSDNPRGLVVQVISNDSHEYFGIEQELIQRILEQRMTHAQRPLDREAGIGEIRNLKVAKGKIRKRIENDEWLPWNGWITTRNVIINPVSPHGLVQHVLPSAQHPLNSFLEYGQESIQIDGPRLDMVNVITGVKGSGKSHLAKHFVLSLSTKGIPCVIFDINGEYSTIPLAQNFRWGETFIPDLAHMGYETLLKVVQTLNPLPENSSLHFESGLRRFFRERRAHCERENIPFTIDLDFLRTQTWTGGNYVADAIDRRLEMVDNLNLFFNQSRHANRNPSNFDTIYQEACAGHPIIFELRGLNIQMQTTLARTVVTLLERICEQESRQNGQRRFPYVFFEEAHFYINEAGIMNIITRGRHIGIASMFVTNSPQKLPDTVFRQLDNLFLLGLTHKDDIRIVSKNSFTDEETIESFATRMPPRHALIIGGVTDRYPIIVEVHPLPANVPPTGETRSTWSRLANQNRNQSQGSTELTEDETL